MKSIITIATIAGLAAAWPFVIRTESACNGNAAFCSRKYSEVSLIGTHDSAFVGSILDPTVNQEKSVANQLGAGIRFLQAQTHDLDGTLEMCHTSCDLKDAGSLSNYLSTIKTFLDGNPNEVVTLLLTNGDSVDISRFGDVFESTGLRDYAFVPSTSPAPLGIDDWPTYQELINAGSRLVAFLDYGADTSTVPYIGDEFATFWETAYDVTDENFSSCDIDRPPGASADGRMSIINHFLDYKVFGIDSVLAPNNMEDYRTNAATGDGSIGAQADLCKQQYGKTVNFVLVDMFDRGDVFTAQNTLNGV